MRLPVDECLGSELVEALRLEGHDVDWVRDLYSGIKDAPLLALSLSQGRIIVSEDCDFGELIFRDHKPAIDIALVMIADFGGPLQRTADYAAKKITELATSQNGHLTVIEPGREWPRPLPGPKP
jgi:hypothetical protein